MSSALWSFRSCLALCVLATATSQPRTPTLLTDAFSFAETFAVPSRDGYSESTYRDDLSKLLQLLPAPLSSSVNGPNGQHLFPLRLDTLQNVSSACRNDSLTLIEALMHGQLWAITVADANFKLPTGVLQGDLNWLGSYSECLGVTVQLNRSHQLELFKAHYCSAAIGLSSTGSNNPLSGQSVNLGLCVPGTCTEMDMQYAIKTALSILSPASVTVSCVPTSTELSASAVTLIVILSCLGAALLAGTLYDILIHQATLDSGPTTLDVDGVHSGMANNVMDGGIDSETTETTSLLGAQTKNTGQSTKPSRLVQIALALSLYTNAAKVLDTGSLREGTLGAVHGIRFLSMTWVMLGHIYVFGIRYFKNPVVMLPLIGRFTFQAIWNATVSVDSFFVMSGTLVAYLLLREMKRAGGPKHINWLHFYLHRYWRVLKFACGELSDASESLPQANFKTERLTPPYMLVMAVWAILFPYMGSGPMWSMMYGLRGMCRSWWRNPLYINNLFPSSQDCMGWMWYMANDMQFYIISPLLLVPLYRSRIIGVALIMALIVTSFIINGVLSYENKFNAADMFVLGDNINATQMSEYFDIIYQTPWCRIGPYLVGMLLGYLLYITDGKMHMPRFVVVLGWMLAAVGNLSVLYGLYNMVNGHHISLGVSAFYNSVFRTVWGVGVAWVIFACVTGHGGFVNRLLSWRAIIPLSRLTYMAYLIHPIVFFFFYASREQLLIYDDTLVVILFLGLLVLVYGLCFLLTISIESPTIALEKVFFPNLRSRSQEERERDVMPDTVSC